MIHFILNEKEITTRLPPGMTLLDFIRYQQHLTGTKIGCREGDCGACTVLLGKINENKLQYQSVTSCLVPLGNAQGKHVVTVEGLNFPGSLNPVQQVMADEGATQCGFCTPGFVVSLTGFCLSDKEATKENAIASIDGNICRCTGYKSIERAAGKIAGIIKEKNKEDFVSFLTNRKIVPDYFATIAVRLQNILNNQASATNNKQMTAKECSHIFIAGGTDLYVQKKEELTNADIHFVFDDPNLNGIRREGNRCVIGSSVTVTDLIESPIINEFIPDFQRCAKLISSTQIRNMATIAGNFINASPIGDLTIIFLALDAQIGFLQTAAREENLTTLPLRKLYKGYKQLNKKPEELIGKIWIELPVNKSYFNFEKVSKRTHLDIASVNSAIYLQMNNDSILNAGLSAGGVGPVPMYLQKTSEYLTGKKITEELIDEAIAVMQTEIAPISDARGSKEYKTLLLGQLIKAHIHSIPKVQM